jgi:hypothetical protein
MGIATCLAGFYALSASALLEYAISSRSNIPAYSMYSSDAVATRKNPLEMKQYLYCPSHKGYLHAACEEPNVHAAIFGHCL